MEQLDKTSITAWQFNAEYDEVIKRTTSSILYTIRQDFSSVMKILKENSFSDDDGEEYIWVLDPQKNYLIKLPKKEVIEQLVNRKEKGIPRGSDKDLFIIENLIKGFPIIQHREYISLKDILDIELFYIYFFIKQNKRDLKKILTANNFLAISDVKKLILGYTKPNGKRMEKFKKAWKIDHWLYKLSFSEKNFAQINERLCSLINLLEKLQTISPIPGKEDVLRLFIRIYLCKIGYIKPENKKFH